MSGRTDEESAQGVDQESERCLPSKLLSSKEISRANSSSRVYFYGGATVPFVWETCPGTPKHTLFSDSSHLPPPSLTPPPSYFSPGHLSSTQKGRNKIAKAKQTHFLETVFHLRKSNTVKGHVSRPSFSWLSTSSSMSSSSSSFSSSSSSVSFPKKLGFHRKRFSLSCSRSPLPYVKDDGEELTVEEEEELRSSPASTLRFGSEVRKRGFSSSMESLKRVLFHVRIHGSTSLRSH